MSVAQKSAAVKVEDPSLYCAKIDKAFSVLIGKEEQGNVQCELTLNDTNKLEGDLKKYVKAFGTPNIIGQIHTNNPRNDSEIVSQTREAAHFVKTSFSNRFDASLDLVRITEVKRSANSRSGIEIILSLISLLDNFLTSIDALIKTIPKGATLSTSITEEMLLEKKARVERKFDEEVAVKRKNIKSPEKQDEAIAEIQKVVESLDFVHLAPAKLSDCRAIFARYKKRLEGFKTDINQKTMVCFEISPFSFLQFGLGKFDKDGNPVFSSGADDSDDESDDVEDSFGGGGKAASSSSSSEDDA
jgi:hypothetical protein